MLFRLRHLNTGRLVVMQEFIYKGQQIKSVGLSDHYPKLMKVNRQEETKDEVIFSTSEEQ